MSRYVIDMPNSYFVTGHLLHNLYNTSIYMHYFISIGEGRKNAKIQAAK